MVKKWNVLELVVRRIYVFKDPAKCNIYFEKLSINGAVSYHLKI